MSQAKSTDSYDLWKRIEDYERRLKALETSGGLFLGKTTLTVARDTITVPESGVLPVRRFLRILVHIINSGQNDPALRFNNDSGESYAVRISNNGAADIAVGSITRILLSAGENLSDLHFAEVEVVNLATAPKQVIAHWTRPNGAVSSAPLRRELVGKWVNSTDAITRVDIVNAGSGDFAAGSRVVVLGHD